MFAFAAPASADADPWDMFRSAYTSPSVGSFQLTADTNGGEGLKLPVNKRFTLDLNGHALAVDAGAAYGTAALGVPTGTSLIIIDTAGGGVLTATGSTGDGRTGGPGLGAGGNDSSGSITIAGGTVNATGGRSSAAIGVAGGTSGNLIISGGTVTASGGSNGAGIGSGSFENSGLVRITGGTVNATGANFGAGIGNGTSATGGTVDITGGIVNARSINYGAGIGSGYNAKFDAVNISGGVVVAMGGGNAAGIGGGSSTSNGTEVFIGQGAQVTASGPTGAVGAGSQGTSFGSLMVAGTLTHPAGATWTIPASASIVGTGTIVNNGTITLNGGIETKVDNHGTILPTGGSASIDPTKVTDHNFLVTFVRDNGQEDVALRVYAASVSAAQQSAPAVQPRDGYDYLGWSTTAGSWTNSTELAGDTTVTAQWKKLLASFDTRAAVAITGDLKVGTTVTAAITTAASPAPSSYTYQWYAEGEPVEGATGASFTVRGSDVDGKIAVRVYPQLDGYDSATGEGYAAGGSLVAAGTFSEPVEVFIEGEPVVGRTLEAAYNHSTPTAQSYVTTWWAGEQFLASGSELELTPELLQEYKLMGQQITARVEPELEGYDAESGLGSDAVAVKLATFEERAEVGIIGDAVVGRTLEAFIDGETTPAATSYIFSWYAGEDGRGEKVGSGSKLYLPAEAVGFDIWVVATPELYGYDEESGEGSESAGTVELAEFAGELRVEIQGVAHVGEKLLADVTDELEPHAEFAYQWYADEAPIAGATSETLAVTQALAGTAVSVRVTASTTGYVPVVVDAESVTIAKPVLEIAISTVTAGQDVVVAGENFFGEGDLTVELHSDPVVLGTITPLADGTFSGRFAVPANMPAGQHTIVVLDAAGTVIATAPLTVNAAPVSATAAPAASASGTLPATGGVFEGGMLTLGAIVLVALGAVLVRRRVIG